MPVRVITTLFAAFSMEQGNGIELAEYEVQVSCHKDSLEFLEAPSASTDCENGGISVSYMDLQFSGGKYGTIQREWTYAD